MTIFDILSFNKELLSRLAKLGIKTNDYVYVDLFNEYLIMKSRNDKMTYIVSTLASKYDISERKVYGIIERLSKHCTNPAV